MQSKSVYLLAFPSPTEEEVLRCQASRAWGWVQGQAPCASHRPHAQKGPMLGTMLCCWWCFLFLMNFEHGHLEFHFSLSPAYASLGIGGSQEHFYVLFFVRQ